MISSFRERFLQLMAAIVFCAVYVLVDVYRREGIYLETLYNVLALSVPFVLYYLFQSSKPIPTPLNIAMVILGVTAGVARWLLPETMTEVSGNIVTGVVMFAMFSLLCPGRVVNLNQWKFMMKISLGYFAFRMLTAIVAFGQQPEIMVTSMWMGVALMIHVCSDVPEKEQVA